MESPERSLTRKKGQRVNKKWTMIKYSFSCQWKLNSIGKMDSGLAFVYFFPFIRSSTTHMTEKYIILVTLCGNKRTKEAGSSSSD
jgi:hypothetical protein